MKGGYFLLNGRFHKEEEAVFTLADLSRRSEGFFEQFRAEHNEVLFASSISRHLIATAASIGIDLGGLVDAEGKLLQKDVSRLLNKNKLYLAAKIGIQVYPTNERVCLLLHAEETDRGFYPVKEPGLLLSIYRDLTKEFAPASAYSTAGSRLRQGASLMAKALGQPNLILLNNEGNACECINGSFALVNDDIVIFPAASSGGYQCAIKDEVVLSAREAGFQTSEMDGLSPEELLQAEELFLFDSCYGIQKVLGLEERRYFGTKTQLIAGKFSALARKEREGKG